MPYKYDVEEEVKSSQDAIHKDEMKYSHPSFGLYSISRTMSGSDRTPLFGSEVPSSSTVRIKIHHAEATQSLGRNWYLAKEQVCEVEMSALQYAEAITNPNTQGMPCTIRYTSSKGTIKYSPIETTVLYTEKKIDSEIEQLKEINKKISQEIDQILSKKGSINKKEKDKIRSLVSVLKNKIGSSLPFYEKSLKENIHNMKIDAITDIEAHITTTINRLGEETLKNNPESLKLILGVKGDDKLHVPD